MSAAVLLDRVDVLVAENLRQATGIIGVVDNKLMTRAVPKEVRIECCEHSVTRRKLHSHRHIVPRDRYIWMERARGGQKA